MNLYCFHLSDIYTRLFNVFKQVIEWYKSSETDNNRKLGTMILFNAVFEVFKYNNFVNFHSFL